MPRAAVGFRPVTQDASHLRQRFNVIDDGRLAPQAALGREGRFGCRHSAPAFNGSDHRGFLTANERSRAFHDINPHLLAAAQNVVAQDALPSPRPSQLCACGARPAGTPRERKCSPSSAPMARAAIIRPSRTLCGLPSITLRSMKAPGSPSSPLQITYFLAEFCTRAASHLRPVGNPPPPRPRRPDLRINSQMACGSISR